MVGVGVARCDEAGCTSVVAAQRLMHAALDEPEQELCCAAAALGPLLGWCEVGGVLEGRWASAAMGGGCCRVGAADELAVLISLLQPRAISVEIRTRHRLSHLRGCVP